MIATVYILTINNAPATGFRRGHTLNDTKTAPHSTWSHGDVKPDGGKVVPPAGPAL